MNELWGALGRILRLGTKDMLQLRCFGGIWNVESHRVFLWMAYDGYSV